MYIYVCLSSVAEETEEETEENTEEQEKDEDEGEHASFGRTDARVARALVERDAQRRLAAARRRLERRARVEQRLRPS